MKKLRYVAVIINPASGIDFPILSVLNRVFKKHHIEWEAFITKRKHHAVTLAQEALKRHPDAMVAYGGDGTILEVASVLYKTTIPLIVLPGGTANVMAKELNVGTDVPTALAIFDRKPKLLHMDVAVNADGHPMFLRTEVGVLADVVRNTGRSRKRVFGALAYPLSAVEQLLKASPSTYTLTLDGVKKTTTGVTLAIANVGNIGIPGISIQKDVSCTDKLLDVFVLQSKDLGSLLSVGTSTLVGTQKPPALKHWKVKHVTVDVDPPQSVLCDDHAMETNRMDLRLSSATLSVLA